MIKCRTCNTLKDAKEYYSYKGKINGKQCKSCRSLQNKREYENKKANSQVKDQPDEKICSKCGESKALCMYDKNPRTKDGHTGRCKDCINQKRRERYTQKTKPQKKELYIKNKEYYTSYRRERMRRDPRFKLRARFSTLISQSIKKRTGNSCFEHLSYSIDGLIQHLENHFVDGMSWDNYGDWHIDHVYPQSRLPYNTYDDANFEKCWALKNLRPLWAADNIKKSNKILFTCTYDKDV